jgi:hypothetical protein
MMDYDALDPGIRATVHLLREHGFTTTDSGDGVSKPADWYSSGDALQYPHVAAIVDRARMCDEADRMQSILGEAWVVEASYRVDEGAVLFARQECAAERRVAPQEPLEADIRANECQRVIAYIEGNYASEPMMLEFVEAIRSEAWGPITDPAPPARKE